LVLANDPPSRSPRTSVGQEGQVFDVAWADDGEVSAVEAGDPMMLNILYGDWEGGQRVISQFALRRANDKWLTSTGRHFNVDRPDPR